MFFDNNFTRSTHNHRTPMVASEFKLTNFPAVGNLFFLILIAGRTNDRHWQTLLKNIFIIDKPAFQYKIRFQCCSLNSILRRIACLLMKIFRHSRTGDGFRLCQIGIVRQIDFD